MLITINLQDKKAYLYRLFQDLWTQSTVECQICFDKIVERGIVIVSEHATLNLEKMFHGECFARWYSTATNKHRDPFNRPIKYKFNFPPTSMEECSFMLDQIRGFIGEEQTDKQYSMEYNRVLVENSVMDIELDFNKLLSY
ncbi:AC53 [Trabala vishnou gigantina nucleopolyhedrovirus]|uniref:AC53 n=1 Tax=Trabala vishnou gigantina nucleopolyhedrovirus TaxID=2863583 RepID=UPI0024820E41|nr:AC53 [Trabala vishnou gigantina nucleopolyhedrovirus]QYC92758.1 AC53 [Trabala vishnou gigantina nucleopolyhedrovirus]